MNAEELDFSKDSFDLIIGSGVIYHLELDKFFGRVTEILKPDGKAIFVEPQGENFLINLFRKFTPRLRTEDEHPLKSSDYSLMKKYFSEVNINYFHFMTLLAVPLRNFKMFKSALSKLENIDRIVFRFKFFRRLAWQVVIELSKPIK